MDDEEVLRQVREILCAIIPADRERFQRLTLTSDVRHIGVDSLQLLEMIARLEDLLARAFDERELAKVQRIADIATLIREGRIASARSVPGELGE
jgi:acyl carrier protein